MPLTPLDIHNKEFSRGFRGYDEDEVNDFLDQIIKDYETLIREKKELEGKFKNAEEKLSHFSNIETTLNKSILVAQETAEEVKQNAKKESKLIVMEAKKNADRIINEALEKSRKVTLNIEELKKEANVYRTRFQMLIEAQLELLKSDDWKKLTIQPEDEKETENEKQDDGVLKTQA
ncbi:DivIVA domain-containing protein [Sporolactobacillus sp. Y61]|jgi:cell division initiation protein|uniref:DivIVA domain-containing protein n=1 Tax=Sporolactobacillus sp. Y61 TaxID=3160863 RepID=A0AAU8IBY6_9BACL|nr:DivIVA domain-containing protein [Sporolactobacillus sp. THM19-2]RYL92886.1 DivIVA domain-containing protein [Sporolactobacillus sp. THM19-2]